MSDIISKIIGVILAFVLLIITPMVISRMAEDMSAKRLILNEVTMFIDKVTDKGSISGYDVDDLLLGINSYGGAFNATVAHYKNVAVKDGTNGVKNIYVAADDNANTLALAGSISLDKGDAVRVNVTGIGVTKGQSLLRGLLHVFEKPFEFSLAGTVR